LPQEIISECHTCADAGVDRDVNVYLEKVPCVLVTNLVKPTAENLWRRNWTVQKIVQAINLYIFSLT
jgi:hypothetical protein